jgi:hypothetical protein
MVFAFCLYSTGRDPVTTTFMNFADALALWVGGLVVAALLCHFTIHHFSPAARDQRKRRRNYGKIITKARRRVVMLNVHASSKRG